MGKELPATRKPPLRDALHMIVVVGLENVTKSLIYGDRHELDALRPLANRCRALANAYDERMKELNE